MLWPAPHWAYGLFLAGFHGIPSVRDSSSRGRDGERKLAL
jgi:hypothetical protein